VIRVLIADDHAILRRGLKEILERELEGAVCGEAKDAGGILGRIHESDWDLVILDISMPGRSGLDVLRELKAARPKLPILVLSMYPEDQYAKRSLKAGAGGYLNKESAPEELIKAVRKVLAGGRYVSAALAEKLASDLSHDAGLDADQPLHEALSDREFEVLRMLAAGKTVSQIAEELHLGVTTVSTYRARILEKMRMTTTAELMHYAIHNGLIND
jgi:two-component system invasion response regulator UvrY